MSLASEVSKLSKSAQGEYAVLKNSATTVIESVQKFWYAYLTVLAVGVLLGAYAF